jgi:hypothetical protein
VAARKNTIRRLAVHQRASGKKFALTISNVPEAEVDLVAAGSRASREKLGCAAAHSLAD